MGAHETLEHMEHVSHAGGHGDGHEKSNLGTYVGITMAMLGVLLAFCAAKVGGERTELVQDLVAQSNAQAQYNAQDVKHRVSAIALLELHANAFGPNASNASLNKADVSLMADSVDRYLKESDLAKKWAAAYDPGIEAHVEAQEHFESAQLFAEIGIVIASVALLIKKRVAWFAALALGTISVAIVATTYVQTRAAVHAAEHQVEESSREYAETRVRDKTTAAENELSASIRAWAGVQPKATDPEKAERSGGKE